MLLAAALFVSQGALADGVGTHGEDGGGTIPVPFSSLNRKVELADGENYVLEGRVIFNGEMPFLHVDLDLHYWLATKTRLAMPVYPLVPANTFHWADYQGDRVRVFVTARGKIVSTQGHFRYAVFLVPLKKPAPVEDSWGSCEDRIKQDPDSCVLPEIR